MSPRATARIAGLLYLLTHVTSVGAVVLYGGSGLVGSVPLASRDRILAGGLLEVILAAGVAGTAVALYPLVRRAGRGLSIAYVALRTLEASVILTGVVVLYAAVARPATTAAPGLSPDVASALVLVHDWTFQVGPGLIAPINTVVIAWLLWRSRLVPRAIPALGLGGAVLIAAVNIAVVFGLTTPQALAALPIFAWEVSLAVWLIVRGVAEQPKADGPERTILAQTRTSLDQTRTRPAAGIQ